MGFLQEIEQHRSELQDLCQRLGVRGLRLRLDGDSWKDVTFIGDIDISRMEGYAGRFFDLEDGLVRIFHRSVHLLDEEGVRLEKERNVLKAKHSPTEVELLHAS